MSSLSLPSAFLFHKDQSTKHLSGQAEARLTESCPIQTLMFSYIFVQETLPYKPIGLGIKLTITEAKAAAPVLFKHQINQSIPFIQLPVYLSCIVFVRKMLSDW